MTTPPISSVVAASVLRAAACESAGGITGQLGVSAVEVLLEAETAEESREEFAAAGGDGRCTAGTRTPTPRRQKV